MMAEVNGTILHLVCSRCDVQGDGVRRFERHAANRQLPEFQEEAPTHHARTEARPGA